MVDEPNINRPFLRWAGGKNWLVKQIDQFIPERFNNYIEPFLGGGSIFIHLKSKGLIEHKAYLSDLNRNLITSYKVVKSRPDDLINDLKNHLNEKEYYYSIRNKHFDDPVKAASQFIYLNRTSFNGIYRENLNGVYNVPYGNKQYSSLFDYNNIRGLSDKFKNTYFSSTDFRRATRNIKAGDLVFIDPPYTVAHGNNGFVKYNQKIFAWSDQVRLYHFIEYLNALGAYYIMTNADHFSIKDLFANVGNTHTLNRFSVVGGKGAKRTNYKELIITNTY